MKIHTNKHATLKFVTLVFLLLLGIYLNATATSGHLYISNQLSSSRTNCFIQDKYGFMWIGTDYCLNLFDVYHYVHYYNCLNDTTSKNSHDERCMLVTKNGDLIIGCG